MTDDQLLPQHERTWKGFVRFMTMSAALVVATLVLMALFLL